MTTEIKTINPFSQSVIQTYSLFDNHKINQVLQRSEKAFAHWKKTSIQHRIEKMKKVSEYLKQHKTSLGELITEEMGKVINEAIAEVEKCSTVCDYYIENTEKFLAPRNINVGMKKTYVSLEPIGAVFAVMPWNFPFWQVFRFAVPNLLSGNVCILKHAPNVTECGLSIEKIFTECGFEEGVFQTILIDIPQIEKFLEHRIVQGVTLTGSERAGSSLASLSGKHLKKSVLELGGSDPFIVLLDADIAEAAKVALQSRFINAGQTCISAKRFFIHTSVYADFMHHVSLLMPQYKQGNPLDITNKIGPLSRLDIAQALQTQLNNSLQKGAKAVHKGEISQCNFAPHIIEIDDINNPAFQSEIFGPVMAIKTFSSDDEVLRYANQTDYGLAASVWTRDYDKAEYFSKELESGSVFVNTMVRSDARLPFGGIKKSGYGRELADWGMFEFLNVKTIVIN